VFGVDSAEFLIIIIVAVIFIGPKDLPRALYKLGQVMGKARAMGRHFRTGLDAMVREAELEELQKQWDKENARIMADHPSPEPVMTEKALVDGMQEAADAASEPEQAPADSYDNGLADAVKQSQTPPVEEIATPLDTDAPKGATA
jgi:sec-independent protein translocase protein TatB